MVLLLLLVLVPLLQVLLVLLVLLLLVLLLPRVQTFSPSCFSPRWRGATLWSARPPYSSSSSSSSCKWSPCATTTPCAG